MLLGCLHARIGHRHLDAVLSIAGLGCMGCGSFKKIERSVGPAIEETASESCGKWKKEEKENRGRKFWKWQTKRAHMMHIVPRGVGVIIY